VIAVKKPQRPKKHRACVLLVDDHPIVREGLATIINQQADLLVCGEAEDAAGALEAVARLEPDAVIVDLSLKRGDGLDLIKELHRRHAALPILVLSMHDESLYVERALRAGARGYLMKQEGTAQVVLALHRILDGDIYVSEAMGKKLLRTFRDRRPDPRTPSIERLSDRELAVFRLIGQGYRTRQIAERLHVSVKTINTYRQHIKEKLELDSATEILRHAIQWVEREQGT
jgi:DNA-binding NarL/FixJ family response regulator